MPISNENIKSVVHSFILTEFLPGEDPSFLSDSTPLITGGILDSISTIRLVSHLEGTFGIELQQDEVSVRNLDTVADIVALLEKKLGANHV